MCSRRLARAGLRRRSKASLGVCIEDGPETVSVPPCECSRRLVDQAQSGDSSWQPPVVGGAGAWSRIVHSRDRSLDDGVLRVGMICTCRASLIRDSLFRETAAAATARAACRASGDPRAGLRRSLTGRRSAAAAPSAACFSAEGPFRALDTRRIRGRLIAAAATPALHDINTKSSGEVRAAFDNSTANAF